MIIILKLKKLIHKIHYIDDIGSVKISVIANFTFNFNFLPPIIFTCYLKGSLGIFFFFFCFSYPFDVGEISRKVEANKPSAMEAEDTWIIPSLSLWQPVI